MYSKSSNAYELDWDYGFEKQVRTNASKRKNVKRKPVNKKRAKHKILNNIPMPIKVAVIAFFTLSLICYRCVYTYGLHNSADRMSAQLETITMQNEQMTIAINSQIDSANIAEYAQKHLGLQKIDDRQVIYLTGDTEDFMGKVAKSDEKGKSKGLFGILASATEYLR